MKRAFLLLLILPAVALAQTSDQITFQRTFLLRNVSGTAFNPGPTPHHLHLVTGGVWTSYVEGSVFVTHVTESGPAVKHTSTFSTNWIAAGAQRSIGSRGLLLLRARGSFEPVTIPNGGAPQLVQYISSDGGGPLLDAMRAHDAIGELAADLAVRMTTVSYVHLYAGAVGDPALGPVPYAQRASSEEFAEAPYSYDVAEMAHEATRVVTAGVGGTMAVLDGGVFHHSITTGRHGGIEDGPIDSWSGRLTLTPTRNLAMQVSHGALGDTKRKMTSASISYATDRVASSAIWTRRESDLTPLMLSSFALELLLRASRTTFMARAERVDDPLSPNQQLFINPRTHLTFGVLYDILTQHGYRAGLGVNLDYHNAFNTLPAYYGHKPQSIFLFARMRTEATRR
jgi:hypothetical protein